MIACIRLSRKVPGPLAGGAGRVFLRFVRSVRNVGCQTGNSQSVLFLFARTKKIAARFLSLFRKFVRGWAGVFLCFSSIQSRHKRKGRENETNHLCGTSRHARSVYQRVRNFRTSDGQLEQFKARSWISQRQQLLEPRLKHPIRRPALFAPTVTSDSGYYRVEFLPVGIYKIKISKTGFVAMESSVEVIIGQTVTLNGELQIGSASETIEITSTVPLVDVAKTDVSQNITPTEVQELPMIGRDVANLASLAPGVKLTDSYDPTKNRYAILSVNGQGGRNVNVTVNGVDNKDNTVGGPVMQLPGEAVEEFKVSTQRFSAANGRSEGAAINMITKSGSNVLHGSFFGQFRSEALECA